MPGICVCNWNRKRWENFFGCVRVPCWLEAAAQRHRDATEVNDTLRGALNKLLVILRGLLRLHGQKPPRDRQEIVASSAVLAGFDGAPFIRLLESNSRKGAMSSRESDEVLAQVLRALEQIAAHINSFRPASRSYVAAWSGASGGEIPK